MFKRLRILFLIFVVLSCNSISKAQEKGEFDTFINILKTPGFDNYDSLTNEIYLVLQQLDSTHSQQVAKEWLDSYSENENHKIAAYSILMSGYVYHIMGKNANAVILINKAQDIALDQQDTLLMVHLLQRKASVYKSTYAYDKATECYLTIIDLLKNTELHYQLASTYDKLGSMQYSNASLSRSGNFMDVADNMSNAISEYKKTRLSDKGTKFKLMSVQNTLGLAYRGMNDHERALKQLGIALDLAITLNNQFWVSLINGNIASIYLIQGKLDRAFGLLEIDRDNSLVLGEWGSAIYAILSIGDIYLLKGQKDDAVHQYQYAEQLIDMHDQPNIKRDLYKRYSDYYSSTKNWEQAFTYYKKYLSASDSLAEIHEQSELKRAELRYRFEQQKDDLELLSKKNELLAKDIRLRNTLFTVSVVFVLIMAILLVMLFRWYRDKKTLSEKLIENNTEIEAQNEELAAQSNMLNKQNLEIQSHSEKLEKEILKRTNELKKSNKELDTYLYRSSHDVRSPISTILGLSKLSNITNDPTELKNIMDKVADTANNMDLMLRKMQSLYALHKNQFETVEINFKKLMQEFTLELQEKITKKNVTVNTAFNHQYPFYADNNLMMMVVFNICENSIEFSNPKQANSYVSITTQNTADRSLLITIADNGIGIEKKYIDQIFSSYFRGSQASQGNGLGLYIAKTATTKLGGTLSTKSELGKGSTFTIELPGA